jgi:hypothetical protein
MVAQLTKYNINQPQTGVESVEQYKKSCCDKW